MEKTPLAMRRHVVLVGSTNAGKSTLFNALTGQQNAIVSPLPGTTTDPVAKAMELLGFGPIVLVDTAGLGDGNALGRQRESKTRKACRRADAALYVADAAQFGTTEKAVYEGFCGQGLPHLLVFTKCDAASAAGAKQQAALQAQYPQAVLLQNGEGENKGMAPLCQRLAALLAAGQEAETPLVGGLVPGGGHVLLVAPIDSGAPKGRLILPQVQVLRDCLDHGITATMCRELELEGALKNARRVDLVVTDSQAFAYVDARVPQSIPLTSFSMLLARQKGGFAQMLAGAKQMEHLQDGACVLMLEGCTHNHTHEDIGRSKIPAMLQQKTGKRLRFDFYTGYDFPDELSPYSLAIQCGGCMLNEREVAARRHAAEAAGLPLTNYGVALAWGAGILARASAIFTQGSAP